MTQLMNEIIDKTKPRIIALENKHEKTVQKYGLIASVLIFTIATSWWADSLPIHNLEDSNFISLIISTLLVTLSLVMFNRYKNTLCSTNVIKQQTFQPHKAVITLLSGTKTFNAVYEDLRPTTLEAAIEKNDNKEHISQHPWRQALRSLYINKELTHLYIISSVQNHHFFDDYKSLMVYYCPTLIIKHITPNGIDYEDLKDVDNALAEAIRHAKTDGFNMVDVTIDITGGQKTASIAAANDTLQHKDLEFFYVASGDTLNVSSYNAISEKSEAPAS